MGKLNGFLEIQNRVEEKNRDPKKRIDDFKDIHLQIDPKTISEQASRCMDCGVPFCHWSCPLGNLIPEFNDLVYQGKWKLAYERLTETNNFPEITGRVCPALCEGSCVLGINFPPETVKNIEKTISDFAFWREYVQPQPSNITTEKKVAIIGSGPAGLGAAQQLTRAGHTVIVYEKNPDIGGLLRYGIPAFKLDKKYLDLRKTQMEAEGTKFRCNIEIGKDIKLSELQDAFDAILIATGTEIARDMKLPNRKLKGIHLALDYLNPISRKELNIEAKDKNVVIIGAGDTGSDCLGTALRQKAKSITSLQILPQNPKTRAASNPWPLYPLVDKTSSSEEEGKITKKLHLLFETGPLEFIPSKTDPNQIGGLKIANFKNFKVVPGTEKIIDADLVFIAVGFQGTKSIDSKLKLTDRDTYQTDSDFKTNYQNIFACGDARRGQSLVVWAIAEGRSAASSIDSFLSGHPSELPSPILTNSKPFSI